MTLREDALREPGRPEAQTKALIYIGDQLAELTAAIEHQSMMQHKPPTLTTAESIDPAPKGSKTKKPTEVPFEPAPPVPPEDK